MAFERYYFNISTGEHVRSFDEPTPIDPPTFGNGDNRDFETIFLKSTGEASDGPVEIMQAVMGAQLWLATTALVALTNTSAGAAVNNAFPFVLPISGANVTTLMTGKTTKQLVLGEYKLTTADGTNSYDAKFYIKPRLNSDAVPDATVSEPAVTMSEVVGVSVPREWPAGTAIRATTTSGLRFLIYPGDDAQWHFDPI
jgi:hypothetical protein